MMNCKWIDTMEICRHSDVSFDGVLQPCVMGPCPHQEDDFTPEDTAENAVKRMGPYALAQTCREG